MINANLLITSLTVSNLLHIIDQIFAFDKEYTPVWGEPINNTIWPQETRNIALLFDVLYGICFISALGAPGIYLHPP